MGDSRQEWSSSEEETERISTKKNLETSSSFRFSFQFKIRVESSDINIEGSEQKKYN